MAPVAPQSSLRHPPPATRHPPPAILRPLRSSNPHSSLVTSSTRPFYAPPQVLVVSAANLAIFVEIIPTFTAMFAVSTAAFNALNKLQFDQQEMEKGIRTSLAGVTGVDEIVRTQRPSLALQAIEAWKGWERILRAIFFGSKFNLAAEMGYHLARPEPWLIRSTFPRPARVLSPLLPKHYVLGSLLKPWLSLLCFSRLLTCD